MKIFKHTHFSIISFALALLLSLFLLGCGLFGISSTKIIGTWSADIMGKVYYTFEADHSFTSQYNLDSGGAQRHSGRYSLIDSRLTINYDEKSLETEILIIDDINSSFLSLKTTGIAMNLTFVKESREPTYYSYSYKNNSDYEVTVVMDIGYEFSIPAKTNMTAYTWKYSKTFTPYGDSNHVTYNYSTDTFENK